MSGQEAADISRGWIPWIRVIKNEGEGQELGTSQTHDTNTNDHMTASHNNNSQMSHTAFMFVSVAFLQ